jgi:hypothetical protein
MTWQSDFAISTDYGHATRPTLSFDVCDTE